MSSDEKPQEVREADAILEEIVAGVENNGSHEVDYPVITDVLFVHSTAIRLFADLRDWSYRNRFSIDIRQVKDKRKKTRTVLVFYSRKKKI